MKKILLMTTAAVLAVAPCVRAETVSGKVTAVTPSSVTITLDNGEKVTLGLSENTTYRSKKYHHKHKVKRGGQDSAGSWHYQPMFEEDDYVEVIYSKTGEPVAAAAESVVVYED